LISDVFLFKNIYYLIPRAIPVVLIT